MKKIFQAATTIAQTLLATRTEPLPVGTVAPNFTAVSTKGDVELAPLLLKGPVVLALYYADFTPG
jgi:peroxiredoxin